MYRAYLGLGANLGDAAHTLRSALCALQRLPSVQLRHHSRLYRSAPVGPQDQPDFINAAAAIDTDLAPLALLHTLQALELAAGRQKQRHWGERSLDLDILVIDRQIIRLPGLTVPHTALAHRDFVITPLRDIAPSLVLPDGRAIDALNPPRDPSLTPLAELEIDALINGTN